MICPARNRRIEKMKTLKTLAKDSEIYESIRDTVDEGEVSYDGLAVSEEEYREKYYNDPDFSYEWNNGVLEVKPMADIQSSHMYQWFSDILRCYFSTYPVGIIVNLEIGFRLALSDKTSIRKPDMGIILHKNAVAANPEDCNYDGIFDMCIESLSYSDIKEIKRDTSAKKKEYEGIGVKEYYILDARGIETSFYRLSSKGKYQKIRAVKKDIIRSDVLDGFQFRISDLYRQPSLKNLAEDDVYCKYVLPFYQDIKKQAEQEKHRAEHAEKQLLLEREKARRLADRLAELGINLE